MMANLAVDCMAVAGFCREHHIRRLGLFGSVLQEDFGTSVDASRP
jgi:predicted nucleotidyltransferase